MNEKMTRSRGKSFIPALIVSVAVIISCALLVFGFLTYKMQEGHKISATGSASVDFSSDLVVWRGSFSVQSLTSQSAYTQIKNDAKIVKNYLKENGLKDDEIVFNSVDIRQTTEDRYDEGGNFIGSYASGYELTQSVVITSTNLDTVDKISRDISSLLESGVEFESNAPEYYCTTLDDVKLDLIEQASANAKKRIEIMANGSGATLGKMQSCDLGIFQITAKNTGTSDYSYDGYLDTSSREKTASITVHMTYGLK